MTVATATSVVMPFGHTLVIGIDFCLRLHHNLFRFLRRHPLQLRAQTRPFTYRLDVVRRGAVGEAPDIHVALPPGISGQRPWGAQLGSHPAPRQPLPLFPKLALNTEVLDVSGLHEDDVSISGLAHHRGKAVHASFHTNLARVTAGGTSSRKTNVRGRLLCRVTVLRERHNHPHLTNGGSLPDPRAKKGGVVGCPQPPRPRAQT
mmetsp:Transcript_2377/g.4214  ORF Transcript_2377/g.4214 Transcript_2377/m.4214 type:complete len:204 (-) Transcript_2377:1072-1683(-)